MTHDPETIRAYDTHAEDYKNRFSDDTTRAIEAFHRMLPAGARVLDIGCGPGNAAAFLNANGCQSIAIDASQEMVSLAKAAGVDAHLATFDDIPGLGPFDGVWANFSLLHAAREAFPRHLTQIRGEMRDGGIFHLGMKTGDGESRDRLGRHYTYHSKDSLVADLNAAGFSVVSSHAGAGAGLAGDVSEWVILLARADG